MPLRKQPKHHPTPRPPEPKVPVWEDETSYSRSPGGRRGERPPRVWECRWGGLRLSAACGLTWFVDANNRCTDERACLLAQLRRELHRRRRGGAGISNGKSRKQLAYLEAALVPYPAWRR